MHYVAYHLFTAVYCERGIPIYTTLFYFTSYNVLVCGFFMYVFLSAT